MGGEPDDLRPRIEEMRTLFTEAGRPAPETVVMTGLPLDDPPAAAARARAFAAAGVTGLVSGVGRYPDAAAFRKTAEALGRVRAEVQSD